jgi:hypothetical protein
MIAAALDPRFKTLAGIPTTEHASLWSLVASEALTFRKHTTAASNPVAALSSSSSLSSPSFMALSASSTFVGVWRFFDGMYSDSIASASATSARPEQNQDADDVIVIHDEIARFKGLPVLPHRDPALSGEMRYNSPLDWWRTTAPQFPWLAPLARAYLAVPATSAPVERLFSIAGNVISSKRTRLSDGAASDLIVLRQSWATCAALLPGFMQCHLPEAEQTPAKRARPSLLL